MGDFIVDITNILDKYRNTKYSKLISEIAEKIVVAKIEQDNPNLIEEINEYFGTCVPLNICVNIADNEKLFKKLISNKKCKHFINIKDAIKSLQNNEFIIYFEGLDLYGVYTKDNYLEFNIIEKIDENKVIPYQVVINTSKQKLVFICIDDTKIDKIRKYVKEFLRCDIIVRKGKRTEIIVDKIVDSFIDSRELFSQLYNYIIHKRDDTTDCILELRQKIVDSIKFTLQQIKPVYINDNENNELFDNKNINEPSACQSKGEVMCAKILKELFANFEFKKVRPDWLKNPDTGRNLELDFYCENLKLAIEINGRQHYEEVKHFHRNEFDFPKQLIRDEFKISKCSQMGIRVISVPNHIVTENEMKKFIYDKYIETCFYKH